MVSKQKMRNYYLIILLSITFVSQIFATHIVGVEIELLSVKGENNASHRLTLNLYFDNINGLVEAIPICDLINIDYEAFG